VLVRHFLWQCGSFAALPFLLVIELFRGARHLFNKYFGNQ